MTALTSVRVPMGLVGSSGTARVSFKKGFTHHALAIALSMAKIGSTGKIDSASAASRKLTWLSAMIGFAPAFSRFSKPFTSSR